MGETLEIINAFEEELVDYFETKLGEYEMAKHTTDGRKTLLGGDVAVGFSCVAAVVTAGVALPIAAAVTMGTAGPLAVLGTVVVGKHVIRLLRRKECKATVTATKRFAKSTMAYFVEQAGKELSRIFDYQCSRIIMQQGKWQGRLWT